MRRAGRVYAAFGSRRLHVRAWRLEAGELVLDWTETGTRAVDGAPVEVRGRSRYAFAPDGRVASLSLDLHGLGYVALLAPPDAVRRLQVVVPLSRPAGRRCGAASRRPAGDGGPGREDGRQRHAGRKERAPRAAHRPA